MFSIKTLVQKHTLPKHYHLPYFAFSHIYLYLSTKTQSFVYMKIFKRKFAIVFTSLLIILLFPACFEIVEEVSLNNDGSGSFCFTINMSQSKLNINAMLLLDSVNGRPVPKMENMKKTIGQVEQTLANDGNITNVKTKQNWEDYIFSISGDFKSIESLNKAINQIYELFNKQAKQPFEAKEHFSYSNKVFKRIYNFNLANNYNSLSEKDKVVLKDARYTSIYRFKTGVGTYSNADALKSKSGTALMLKENIKDLITNHKTIENTVHLN